jgi:hypothetical protein
MSPTPLQSSAPPWPLPTRITCATPDLLLKHPDVTVAIYKRRQMKHLKHALETLVKTPEKYLKTIANQYPDETLA